MEENLDIHTYIYLGHSPLYAGSMALIFKPLNGEGSDSPYYHVVFEDEFSTVSY